MSSKPSAPSSTISRTPARVGAVSAVSPSGVTRTAEPGYARVGASDLPASASDHSAAAEAPTPAAKSTAAGRQKVRRARVKAQGLLTLRLDVTPAEAAHLKAALQALRQTQVEPPAEVMHAPEATQHAAQDAKQEPQSEAKPSGGLAELRRLAREKRERDQAGAEQAKEIDAEEARRQRVRQKMLARLRGSVV